MGLSILSLTDHSLFLPLAHSADPYWTPTADPCCRVTPSMTSPLAEAWGLGPLLLSSNTPSSHAYAHDPAWKDAEEGSAPHIPHTPHFPHTPALAVQQLLLRGLLGSAPGGTVQLLTLGAVQRLAELAVVEVS